MQRAPAALLFSLAVTGCGDLAAPPDPTPLRGVEDRAARSVTPGGTTYEIVDLGGPRVTYGYATAINAGGEIVGDFEDERMQRHAFRWSGAMTDLGTLGGPYSQTYRITSGGTAVGAAYLNNDVFHAVKWDGATITDLGTLPGDRNSFGWSIGEGGHVVGTSYGSDRFDHAFVWHNGVMTHLPPVVRGSTRAFAVNATGDVVGSSDGPGSGVAVIWRGGRVTSLGTLGGYSSTAVDINDAGQVVGTAELVAGSYARHAYRWENGSMTDLGTIGGEFAEAIAINARGDVVGWSTTDASNSDIHGFVWRDGRMTDLALPGGVSCAAVAINDVGQVAGSCFMPATGKARSFLWENGVMTELGTLGGHASAAIRGINNAGHIVGSSETPGGQTRPVLWRPAVITVSIDVKPGSATNPVNPKGRGVIPVAILGSATFDAATVDVASVQFGPGNAVASRGAAQVEDVNGDGYDDMVLHFDTQGSGIACGTTTATLTGKAAGKSIRGSDTIVTVGCR